MQHSISDTTAIRLFNSVAAAQERVRRGSQSSLTPINADLDNSVDSFHSANEFGNSCRICRYHRRDLPILPCPCQCKGSVGYVHLQCLKRWIMQRRNNRCEICNTEFTLPPEQLNVRSRLRNFFSRKCLGNIIKHLVFNASLVPLAHVILGQVLICMESINQNNNPQLSPKEVVLATFALLTSSAIFFHFFEFVTTRFLIIRNIIRQWWVFGGSSDFELIDLENDIMELF